MPVTEETILRDLFQLRTHPFRPTVGPDGEPITPGILSTTLNPFEDKRHLLYYFDFYTWHHPRVLSGITRETGLRRFRIPRGERPLLLIIDGYSATGRKSLARLIESQILSSHNEPPIVIEVELNGRDANVYARELSNAFVDTYIFEEQQPDEERLRSIIETSGNQEATSPGTGFQNIFQRFKTFVRRFCPTRPIVFVVSGIDSLDGWRQLHNILSSLANYVVIITTDNNEARVGRDNLPRQPYDFASVSAPKLYLEQGKNFLRWRFSKERPDELSKEQRESLVPFESAAIAELFLPGSRQPGKREPWQIGWIIEKMSFALDEHLKELRQEVTRAGDDPARVPANKRLITKEAMQRFLNADKNRLFKLQGIDSR